MSPEPITPLPTADDAEPKSGASPMPIILIGLFALLAYWGMMHLNDEGGGFSKVVYAPYADEKEVFDAQVKDPRLEFFLHGALVFSRNCSPCHQNSGMGVPGQFPYLVGSDWVNAKSPNRIARIVLCGFGGPLVLNGQPFNTSAQMTPFRDSLSDEDIAAVLTFIRSNKDWHNDAPDVDPNFVKTIRDKVKNHPGPFAPADLLKLGPND